MQIIGMKRVCKIFKAGSVCVCGQRGRGKDLLMSNVAFRQGTYISNISYGGDYIPLDFSKLDVKNLYKNLVTGEITPYEYPYPEGIDIFISDIGIYFPSQYCDKLNREYPTIPVFLGLSRQIARANVHLNTQYLGRAWDKYREQSDSYILCLGVFKPLLRLGIAIQKVRVYELYESCLRRVPPFSVPKPKVLANKEIKQAYEIEKARYDQQYGKVREYLVIYRHKSRYDDRHFKKLLARHEAIVEAKRLENNVDTHSDSGDTTVGIHTDNGFCTGA